MAPTIPPPHLSAQLRLSPNWFFPDGDLLVKCEDTLFLVHSRKLADASIVFREALGMSQRTPPPSNSRYTKVGWGRGRMPAPRPSSSTAAIGGCPHTGLSLSARLYLRQAQRIREREARAQGVHHMQFSAGIRRTYRTNASASPISTTCRASNLWTNQPRMLTVADRAVNMTYLLHFLYSTDNTNLIKPNLVPHLLSLSIRYKIPSFAQSSLRILRSWVKSNPVLVASLLYPFISLTFLPPTHVPTGQHSTPQTTTVASSSLSSSFNATELELAQTYHLALGELLDDFPRFISNPCLLMRQEYLYTLPGLIRENCTRRWNDYVNDMMDLAPAKYKTQDLYPPPRATTSDQPETIPIYLRLFTSLPIINGGIKIRHSCCHESQRKSQNVQECDARIRDVLGKCWVEWWERETIITNSVRRNVPRPSSILRLLENIDRALGELAVKTGVESGSEIEKEMTRPKTEKEAVGTHHACIQSTKLAMSKRLRRLVGRVPWLQPWEGQKGDGCDEVWYLGLMEIEEPDAEEEYDSDYDDDDEDDDDDMGGLGEDEEGESAREGKEEEEGKSTGVGNGNTACDPDNETEQEQYGAKFGCRVMVWGMSGRDSHGC